MSRYTCILFDLDGTLVDSLNDLATSMNTVLRSFGVAPHETEAYRYFVGDGIEKLARRALPATHQDHETVSQCVAAMRQEYDQHWADTTKPYPGIAELLDNLTKKGLKKVVFSNKPHDFTCRIVDKILSSWTFDLVLGAQENIPKKPHPAGAIQLATQLNIPVNAFVYLGDTGVDMQTAKSAGMYPVGVLWGFRTAAELKENGADVLLDKPLDLLKHLV